MWLVRNRPRWGDSYRRLLGPDFSHVKSAESLRLRCAAEESQPSAVDVVTELFSAVHSFAQGAQILHNSAGPGPDGSNDSTPESVRAVCLGRERRGLGSA